MQTDRREHERKPACLPAWVTDRGCGRRQQCQAVNISAGGVYLLVLFESAPVPGDAVEITIGTPTPDDQSGFDLHCCESHAEVVRTEHVGYATGIALRFTGQLQPMNTQHHMMPC